MDRGNVLFVHFSWIKWNLYERYNVYIILHLIFYVKFYF